MMCRHCQTVQATRPRVLCWSCYATLDIRQRYPVLTRPTPEISVLLPRLKRYPDHVQQRPCICGRSYDGVCPSCERIERALMGENA